jgi:hypothetical protein
MRELELLKRTLHSWPQPDNQNNEIRGDPDSVAEIFIIQLKLVSIEMDRTLRGALIIVTEKLNPSPHGFLIPFFSLPAVRPDVFRQDPDVLPPPAKLEGLIDHRTAAVAGTAHLPLPRPDTGNEGDPLCLWTAIREDPFEVKIGNHILA